ncbi:unnamed protein product [Cuscuta campestris]|uniref:Uncharacterized protein n=1 Tax=Cuscuta campestris TaxID=132261 RepID=A0A484NA74_9ASTE|nr:unnamed protein product [Cuscuta campestris]
MLDVSVQFPIIFIVEVWGANNILTCQRGTTPGFLNRGKLIVPVPDVDGLPLGQRRRVVAGVEALLADDAVDLSQHLREGGLDVDSLQGGGLHEEGALPLGTARRWRRSDLLPASITTMFWSVWSRSSFSHRCTFSNVTFRVMSYTR